jgi:phospholipase C
VLRSRIVLVWGLIIGVAMGLAELNGCGGGNGTGPTLSIPPATQKIQHVIVIVQENRTPDNLFQDPVLIKEGADIAQSGKNLKSPTGTTVLTPTSLVTDYDLSHAHAAFTKTYDDGNMDGANLIEVDCGAGATNCPPPNAEYEYVQASDVQPYYTLAETYTFGDRMFQTNQGPSYPAHQFLLSGTSMASTQFTVPSNLFVAENPNGVLEPGANTGCTSPPTEFVKVIDTTNMDPMTNETKTVYPCFDHPTLTDLLDQNSISWKYYTPSPGSIWTAPNSISHMCGPNAAPPNATTCTGSDWVKNVVLNQTEVLSDISAGQLPAVSWVIPDADESDHALANTGEGPSWVASIVNAIGGGQYWASSAIIITWDDWGGWYDHVVPPVSTTNSYEMGFRVPLIVVSPYAKAAHISHVQHDFGSILKFVETVFNLPTINPGNPAAYADSSADDLLDCFDFTQTPLKFRNIAAPLDAAHFLNDKRPRRDPDDD